MKTFGCVVVSRNDGHGENLEERATFALNSMINTFDEVIYVDWNSPAESLISKIGDGLIKKSNFKYIVVTPQEALDFVNNKDAQRVVEVLARNIGIRRLTTDFIVSTNIDVIVPKKEILTNYDFKEDTFYTISRRDVDLQKVRNISEAGDLQEYLSLNMANYMPHGQSGACEGDVWSLIDCCGDFQLASREVWESIKGFEESLINRFFSDTNVQKKATIYGHNLIALYDIPVFHIAHKGGKSERINSVLYAVLNFDKTTNPETWGFSNYNFELRGF